MAGKVKVPRSVAGVKVPKGWRKLGTVTSFLNNPIARAVLAEALVAAAGAAATALARNRPSGAQVAQAGEAVADAGGQAVSTTSDIAKSAADGLSGLVSDAARSFLPDARSKSAKRRKKAKKGKARERAGVKGRHKGDKAIVRH